MAETTMPRVHHKTFAYQTSLEWIGARAGVAASPDKVPVRVSAPPEFKGEAGVWTPEDLFLAAAETCLMTTFLALTGRAAIRVSSYTSQADGTLEFIDGGYRMTRIVLRPVIAVADADEIPRAQEALARAHETCIISNSMRTDVAVEPEFRAA